MELTAKNVHETFLNCLYDDDTIKNLKDDEAPEGAILVDGITLKAGFDPVKLKAQKENIKALLQQLPDEFQHNKGGGHSFLNGCMTRLGVQWGEQMNVQQLMLLGIASGFAQYNLPRDMWIAFPGGVPYFVVNTEGFSN